MIHEIEERNNSIRADPRDLPRRRHHEDSHEDNGSSGNNIHAHVTDIGAEAMLDRPSRAAVRRLDPWEKAISVTHNDGEDAEDGAPFPAVSQGRRRDRSGDGRRRSGRHTPEPLDGAKPRRSGSKIKRLSGPLSPRGDEKPNGSTAGSRAPSEERTVGYERPQSADSIDDAVESYLCSPRLSQKIRHPQTGTRHILLRGWRQRRLRRLLLRRHGADAIHHGLLRRAGPDAQAEADHPRQTRRGRQRVVRRWDRHPR